MTTIKRLPSQQQLLNPDCAHGWRASLMATKAVLFVAAVLHQQACYVRQHVMI
jgi:hypothetical protein